MYKCITNKEFDSKLKNCKERFDTLDSSASDRFVIEVENDKYLCKYGNSTSQMQDVSISYTNSALSEYIVCNIINKVFKGTKYKAQETELCESEKNNKIKKFVACKIFKESLVSLFNLAKTSNIRLTDNRTSYLQAIQILKDTVGKEYVDYYNMYIAISMVFGNKDVHSKNFSILEKSKDCIYYDFGASLRNKLSDDGCQIFLNDSIDKQKEKILNERWTYLNDKTKKQIVLFRDIQKNKVEYTGLIPYMEKVIDTTKRENYFVKYFDILEQNKIITSVRKDFYITYIKRNIEIMEDIVKEPVIIGASHPTKKDDYWKEHHIDLLKAIAKGASKAPKNIMTIYQYYIKTKKIVAIKRSSNKKFWDETKKEFEALINQGKIKIDNEYDPDNSTIYAIVDTKDGKSKYICAYNIGSIDNAKRLIEKEII